MPSEQPDTARAAAQTASFETQAIEDVRRAARQVDATSERVDAARAGQDLASQRLDAETKSPGGIVIPDTAAEKPIRGKVVAVGKGKILENGNVRALDIKVGDHILFGKYSGTEVKVDGEEYLVMREEDVMAVIEK